jgi:hypothetical protein
MEIEAFLGSMKWHRAVRRVPFGAQISICTLYCTCMLRPLISTNDRGGKLCMKCVSVQIFRIGSKFYMKASTKILSKNKLTVSLFKNFFFSFPNAMNSRSAKIQCSTWASKDFQRLGRRPLGLLSDPLGAAASVFALTFPCLLFFCLILRLPPLLPPRWLL